MTTPPAAIPLSAPARPTTAAFFASGNTSSAPRGNTELAREIAADVHRVLRQASHRAPRSQQVHLGPSELGHPCHRSVSAKLAGLGERSSSDPWPSIVGTAVHAWLADAFELDNEVPADTVHSQTRWLTEHRVTPLAGHEGTSDLYDGKTFSVLDHKCLGDSSLVKLRTQGPSRLYHVQLLLYALGFMRAGYRVEHIGIIGYPRTGSSLDGIYVWTEPITAQSAAILEQVKADLVERKAYAAELMQGRITLEQIPATPDTCIFCPVREICPDSGR